MWLAADLNNVASYDVALLEFRPDAAVHLAWEGIPNYTFNNSLRNMTAGAQFAAQAFAAGCRRLVVGGSCWEYGSLRGSVEESDEPRRVGVFGACKTAQREVVTALATAANASVAWARIFYAYGPNQKSSSLAPSLCADLIAGDVPKPRTPETINDFVYVDDVAEAILTLVESEVPGIFNIGSGTGVTVAQFAAELAKAAGIAACDSTGVVPYETAGLVADISKLTSLGWKPRTPLPTGIAETWSWFRREYQASC
jgi:nucleoside-diphosphate-sugar epimerase